MSKFLGAVGQVAGVVAAVALIGSGIGAALGGTMILAGVGSAASIASVAGAISAVATAGSQLTAKPPAAKGSIQQRLFGSNSPLPYTMGETYAAGVQVHDIGWGGKVSKVENPYRFIPVVYSCAGPIDSLTGSYLDFAAVSFSGGAALGYYAGFLYQDTQLGASPESDALAARAGWGTPPGWGSSYKLSGFAAVGWSFQFDKKGNIFAGGSLPQFGVTGKWVKVYDPRLDSTYPGGSGSHRINDESTWSWSANPALHAIAYAYGRHQNGVRIFGGGLIDAIDLPPFVALANICDANGWVVGGTIYEPGDKWNNLKRILQTAAAEPVLGSNGLLTVKFQASRTSLDTITADDLVGADASATALRPWTTRINTIVPRFRSPAHEWNYVQATAQSVSALVMADGEEKSEEIQYDLVQSADQVAQLALYEIYNRREAGPFIMTVKPRLKDYVPGDTLTLDAGCGLWPTDVKVVVTRRSIDPITAAVTFELQGETDSKHAAALAATASGPPTVVIPTGADRDAVMAYNQQPDGFEELLVRTSNVSGVGGSPLTATDAGTDATIAVAAHSRIIANETLSISAASITALAYSTVYHVYFDDPDRAGGAVSFVATTTASDAQQSTANPDRFYVGSILTPASGAAPTDGSGGAPPGWGGTISP